MVQYNLNQQVIIIPLVALLIKELLWNVLIFVLNPIFLNIPAQILLLLIYLSAGYAGSSIYNYDKTNSAINTAITGGLGATISGVVISPIFYRMFFYMPGIPVLPAIFNIASSSIQGGVIGYIGSLLSNFDEFDFYSKVIWPIYDGIWLGVSLVFGVRDVKKLREMGYDDEDLRLLNKLFHGEEPYWLEGEEMGIKRIMLKIYDGQETDLLSGLSVKDRKEVEDSLSGEFEPEYFSELNEEDQRTIAEQMPLNVIQVYYHVTEKDLQKIVQMRVKMVTKSGDFDDDYVVDNKIRTQIENKIFENLTDESTKELYKKSEKAKSRGLINGIIRTIQKLAE